MKLTTILLLAFNLAASAATFAQQITLREKNAKLADVLKTIRIQSGYDIVYKTDDINGKTVTINVTNAGLGQTLTQTLKNQHLTYTIQDGTIIIKTEEADQPSFIDKIKAALVQVNVQGKVQDELGNPLPGATIRIKNSNLGTQADKNGNFAITVPDDKTILVFSYTSYETLELQARNIANGSVIILKATTTNLNEVIVNKGYYQERKELSTGSTGRITAKEIGQQPVSDPLMALEGRIPGLSITQASGMPGAALTVSLRGQNSIQSGNNPLYIIDGVPYPSNTLSNPFTSASALGGPSVPTNVKSVSSGSAGLSPFNSLDPNHIETIEVLKDADATAIYGSRGGNGVVLITTKKGKAGQTKVDLNVYSGYGQTASKLKMLNTQQYLQMRHEAFKNDKADGAVPDPNYDYDITGAWDTTRYTDWQKVMIGNTSHFTNAQMNVSGGNTNTQFVVGGAYNRQTTVFPGEYRDTKASVHSSITHRSVDNKFNVVFSSSYSNENNLLPSTDFSTFITLAPDAPALYNPDGTLNWQNGTWVNPMSYLSAKASSIANNLIGNLALSYQVFTGLKIQANLGYTKMQLNQSTKFYQDGFSYGPPQAANRKNSYGQTNSSTWIIEPQVTYDHDFGKGKLGVLAGTTFQDNAYGVVGYFAQGFLTDAQIVNPAAASSNTIYPNGNYASDYRYNAFYTRINYNFDDRYIINATGRRDGSSRFGEGSRFGNFGAVGAAWLFSNEKFLKNFSGILSFGKLRTSYGSTGNDQIPDYQYLNTYSNNNVYQGIPGLIPTRIANQYYSWERNNKLEFGIELGFLSDRLHLETDYYRNRTGNQLVGYPLPAIAGFTTVQYNLPAIVQNTGLEFQLNTVNIKGKDFSWNSAFNISFPKNKLVSYPGLASSPYASTLKEGRPLSIFPFYHETGVDPQTGLYNIQDINGDGQFDSADYVFVDVNKQNYFGGFQNSFNYKNISLDIFLQFVKQNGLNYQNSFAPPGLANYNEPVIVLQRWTKPGDVSSIQRFATDYSATALYPAVLHETSNKVITDASYIRLKNVSLSYTWPASWKQRLHLQNVRLFVQAQNLLTFTNYYGLDPETKSFLPPLRMITAGFNVSL